MSMYSLYQRNEDEETLTKEVDRALGGNLCRDTGYRPIKQAASRALSMCTGLPINKNQLTLQAATAEQLRLLSARPPESLNLTTGFYQPNNLNELARLVDLQQGEFHVEGQEHLFFESLRCGI